jgi:spermidine synthase
VGAGTQVNRRDIKSKTVSSGKRPLYIPLLVLLFAASGCAALIYEIVWFQLLQLVIGSSGVSLGLLLACYMAGLCAGSILLPRFVSSRFHPLKVFSFLEFGIGILGLLVLIIVPLVGRMYQLGVPDSMTAGVIGLVLRGIVAGACLLPPTLFMGGSLPAVARWLETTPEGVSRVGLLYSANIAGAVFGSLLSGFVLLRVYDMAVATYVAVGINVAVGMASLILSTRTEHDTVSDTVVTPRPMRVRRIGFTYLAIAISGLAALGAEVVWTRLLSLLLGGTVYTFAIILAVFLGGLWLGSGAGAFIARRIAHPVLGLAACQILVILGIGWTAFNLSYSLPYWPVDPWLSLNPVFNFQVDFVRCVWAILPAALLWGASFPLALAAVAEPGEDPGRLSGRIYAANTAGAIAGALVFSLFLIPALGTRGSQQALIALSAAGAIAAAISAMPKRPTRNMAIGVAAVAVVCSVAVIISVHDVPWEVVAYGRRIAPTVRATDLYPDAAPMKVLFRGEGINSSVVIADRGGIRQFYVSGKAEASSAPADMRLERMMGHLPALLHPNPRSVLTVGFGAGVTAGSFVAYPDVEDLVICELESLIPPASTKFFGAENYSVMHDRRTRIVYDDARHFIFTTKQTFDVITTDPIHPWVKGTSTLYSKEYYQLVKAHLKPGGVVAQWLPIYDSDPATVKSELATFFDVFPNGTVWSNYVPNVGGYDLVLIGGNPTPINIDSIQERLDRPEYSKVLASIGDVGFHSAAEVLATYAGRATDLSPYFAGAEINNDMNLRLQYLAGLGVNSMAFQKVLAEVLAYRKFPTDLFHGSDARVDVLRTLLRVKR